MFGHFATLCMKGLKAVAIDGWQKLWFDLLFRCYKKEGSYYVKI